MTCNNQVEATLLSFDGMSRAQAPTFFYARLLAKLNKQISPAWWQQLFVVAAKPAFSVIVLLLFLVLNITTITIVLQDKKKVTSASASTTLQGFAQEYNFSISTVYTDKTTK